MKTISTFAAFIFLFLLIAPAQEEPVNKKGSKRSEQQKIIYTPTEDPKPINDLYDGGGGYETYFYYGDPTGMYFNKEWEKGNAEHVDGTKIEGEFRYNLYHQKMQAIVDGDTFSIAKPSELEWLKIGDRKFIYSTFVRSDREVSNTWFEVLCDGDCELLLRRYIKYRVSDGDDDRTNDQLYKLKEYYTRKDDAGIVRIYTSKKSLLEAMQEHEAAVSKYIKEEKLKIKDQKDLVKLFVYYNSLE